MAIIKLTTELMHEEYVEKEQWLERAGTWAPSGEFYSEVLHTDDPDKPTMMVIAGETFKVMPLDEILTDAAWDAKQNWYISMADYFQDCLKQELLDVLHAFVMDIDFIRPKGLELILEGMRKKKYPLPTYIVNSGSGLHFYYVLDKGLDMYPTYRRQGKALLKAMHKRYDAVYPQIGVAQPHWMGQPYRVVGSMTKAEDIVKAYRIGDVWKVDQLAEAFGREWKKKLPRGVKQPPTERMIEKAKELAEKNGSEICDLTSFRSTYKFIDEEIKKSRNMGKISRNTGISKDEMHPEGWKRPSEQWYHRTVYDIQKHTQEGYRYTSLMALAVIAIKCGIPYEQLEKDAWRQADIWYEDIVHYATVFNRKNVPDALRMYDYKYAKVTRKQLEEWLGWEFRSHVKRNGRKQDAHLYLARRKKEDLKVLGESFKNPEGRPKGSGEKKEQVKDYLRLHPDAKKAEIIRETGLSKPTVYKWYDIAVKEIAEEKSLA